MLSVKTCAGENSHRETEGGGGGGGKKGQFSRPSRAAPSARLNKCLYARSAARLLQTKNALAGPFGNTCFLKLRLALRKHVNKHNKTQTVTSAPRKRDGWAGTGPRSRSFVTVLKKVNYELETCA